MSDTSLAAYFCLAGRVALVTGGSGDLGFAIARALGAAGATVVLQGTDEKRVVARCQEVSELGVLAHPLVSDLRDPASPKLIVTRVVEQFGQLDILVNCAGVNRRMPAMNVSDEDYDYVLDLNLRAAFKMCQAAGRVMLSQRSGKVINIGSLTNTLGLGGISIYGMAKAGLGQLTRTLAVEWAPSNIQVNCIIPGFFQTQMTQEVWRDERRVDWLESHIPMRRGGQPDELGGLAVLLSAPSSSYITGQSFAVDGGVLAGSPGYEA
jgi:NAD(P)-dependent dehydrogenase (short-subunit alcohol dehydrogenase family)